MAVGGRIAGLVTISAGGIHVNVMGTAKIKRAVKREGLAGPNGAVGYKETRGVPSIEVEIATDRDIDIGKIEALQDAKIQVEAANGTTYVLRNAWCTGEIEVDVIEGKFTATFEGLGDIIDYKREA